MSLQCLQRPHYQVKNNIHILNIEFCGISEEIQPFSLFLHWFHKGSSEFKSNLHKIKFENGGERHFSGKIAQSIFTNVGNYCSKSIFFSSGTGEGRIEAHLITYREERVA